jgi:hypothetical protein
MIQKPKQALKLFTFVKAVLLQLKQSEARHVGDNQYPESVVGIE